MSAPIRKKPITRPSAAKIASSDPNDLKARFQAVIHEIAVELRIVSDRITEAVVDAIAGASGDTQAVRETILMAVSLKVLERFLEGVSDRISASESEPSELHVAIDQIVGWNS
jgi:hypothetical protein